MNPSALQSLYECRHESQEKWTLWAVAMQDAWPEMYRGLSAAPAELRIAVPFSSRLLRLEAQAIRKLVGQYKGVDLFWATMFDDIADGMDAAPIATPPPAIEVSPKLGEAMEPIKHMVNRFLGWKLPANFRPDGGISFKADYNEHTPWPAKHEPYGTNLFDATQAEAMVRYMLEGLPSSDSAAMKALLELRDAVDAYSSFLVNYTGQLITEDLAAACNKADALLAAPIAPAVEQEK